MKQTIPNSWQENGTLSMIIQKWIIGAANKITYKIEVLKSNLCDYNEACILVRGDISARAASATQVAFKNLLNVY